jgi:hypothetical protein
VPKLNPVRTDASEPTLRATLGPFVCTWDDLPHVQAARTAAPAEARLMLLLLVLGGLLLTAVAPLS